MYNNGKTSSKIIFVKSIDTTPIQAQIFATTYVSATTLSYYTDYSASLLELAKDSGTTTAYTSAKLIFVNHYLAASQSFFSASLTGTFLTDSYALTA